MSSKSDENEVRGAIGDLGGTRPAKGAKKSGFGKVPGHQNGAKLQSKSDHKVIKKEIQN